MLVVVINVGNLFLPLGNDVFTQVSGEEFVSTLPFSDVKWLLMVIPGILALIFIALIRISKWSDSLEEINTETFIRDKVSV